MNDYERFAVDIIQAVLASGNYKPTEALVQRIGCMLESGPMITIWPADVAAAAQRARDRAIAAAVRRPELPRPLTPPQLPRPLTPPTLPRALQPPQLPRPLALPTLPRALVKP